MARYTALVDGKPGAYGVTVPRRSWLRPWARNGLHFASLGRAFQADGRGFSPIEGGLEGAYSVS
jgi:hypothetical protein